MTSVLLQGEELYKDLTFLGKVKGIKIKIVQSYSKKPVNDTLILAKEGKCLKVASMWKLYNVAVIDSNCVSG